MHTISLDKKIHVLSCLVDGSSIRATSRITNVHRDTIIRIGIEVGEQCARLHDLLFRNLEILLLQFDETWSFVGKKQRRVLPVDSHEVGDQYVYIALDVLSRAVISYYIGKRDSIITQFFVNDVKSRILTKPQISTDGFSPYIDAIELAFGCEVSYGQIVKNSELNPQQFIVKRIISGNPDPRKISTSYIERQNLTIRMSSRRFTRRTNGYSKRLRHHKAAIALHMAYYNFCRIHETLRITPAMALKLTNHVWSLGELLEISGIG